MSNSVLTISDITRAALAILRQKLNFASNINTQYDSSFGNDGAQIGDTLRIRKPAKYTIRSGRTLSVQDFEEESVSLKIDKQIGVDVSFTSQELALDIQDFSKLVLEPAMSRIAAEVESDLISTAVVSAGGAITTTAVALKDFLRAGALLDGNAAPMAGRGAWAAPLVQADLVDSLKSLQNDVKQISAQYLEGKMGTGAGFSWYSNYHLPSITLPADRVGAVNVTFTSATTNKNQLLVEGLTDTQVVPAGAAVTVAGVYAVNPETGATLPYLKTWVVNEAVTVTSAATTLKLAESIVAGGVKGANASAWPTSGDAVTIIGENSAVKQLNLCAAKDYMTFATAPLPLPDGVDQAARDVLDGISMRVIRAYDISTDTFPCRIDILYGKKVLRPELGITVQATIS